jgi:hypothetical protein
MSVLPKICFVQPKVLAYVQPDLGITPGGAERQIHRLIQWLSENDEREIHACVADFGQSRSKLEKDGVCYWKSCRLDGSKVIGLYKIISVLRQIDADLYVFRSPDLGVAVTGLILKALGKRTFYMVANEDEGNHSRMKRVVGRTCAHAMALFYRWADGISAQTQDQYKAFTEGRGLSVAGVIPNMLNMPAELRESIKGNTEEGIKESIKEGIKESIKENAEGCIENHLNKNTQKNAQGNNGEGGQPYIHAYKSSLDSNSDPDSCVLWIGRCDPIKRPELFLDLVEALDSKVKKLMVCPPTQDREYYDRIVRRAHAIANMDFREYVKPEQITECYHRASFLVMTSVSEGYSNVMMEAFLEQCPMLSTNINPDGILDEHQLGASFSDAQWQEFVECAQAWLTKDFKMSLREMGARARAFVIHRHAPESVGHAFLEVTGLNG